MAQPSPVAPQPIADSAPMWLSPSRRAIRS